VLGGNHRLEAYKTLQKEQRKSGIEKNRFDSVLGQLYWWPDESPENIREMRALATQNNIEGETRLEMSFWDKVHIFPPLWLLRGQASLFWNKMVGSTTLIMETYIYILHTKKLYISRVRFLDNVNVQSIDPLIQLAASPEEMWNIVAEICQGRAGGDNPLKPPTSITPFKCSATMRG